MIDKRLLLFTAFALGSCGAIEKGASNPSFTSRYSREFVACTGDLGRVTYFQSVRGSFILPLDHDPIVKLARTNSVEPKEPRFHVPWAYDGFPQLEQRLKSFPGVKPYLTDFAFEATASGWYASGDQRCASGDVVEGIFFVDEFLTVERPS